MVTGNSSPVTRHPPPATLWALFTAYCSLIALFFWRHIFTRLILAHGDTFLLFYPTWDYRAAALRAGRIPLWNPITFMGAPFLANSQYGVLYPLNWPLAWLPAPTAIKAAIVIHLIIAAVGAHLFARRILKLTPFSAWFAAALFALGGYLTAHVELVNQLQGLAWLPFIFWATHRAAEGPRRFVPLLSLFIALQLLAGHTQTTFITLVGAMTFSVVGWLLAFRGSRFTPHASRVTRHQSLISSLPSFLLLPASFLLAALLSAAQLLPTLELSRHSLRAGGLPVNEAISFSLDPRLLGLSLLPGYSRALFSEYIGTLGVTGLCLVIVAMIHLRPSHVSLRTSHFAILLVALLGLFFALGRFNPIYVGLARYAPGFNLFRVPARWLALWAFGGAMLAGIGLEALDELRPRRRWTALSFLLIAGLVALTYLSTGVTPAGETGPLAAPPIKDVLLWIATTLAVVALLSRPHPADAHTPIRPIASLLACLALVELFAASRIQPFNQLTTPDAYYSPRPSIEFLREVNGGQSALGRVAATSRLFYDPTLDGGKLSDTPAAARLSPWAAYEFLVASKYKDVLSHNLALTWDVPTLEGYDGGILPLKNYVTFEEYLLGHPPLTNDGRLRENIVQTPAEIPDGRALSLANVRYFIADKTFDFWIDDIYYDFTHHAALANGQTATVADVPDFAATSLNIVSFLNGAQSAKDGLPVAEVALTFADGQTQTFTLRAGMETAEGVYAPRATAHQPATLAGHFWPDRPEIGDYLARLRWNEPRRLRSISVRGLLSTGEIVIHGLTLVDEYRNTFSPLVLSSSGRYRLAYSGDVKVYENLDALPRAFIVGQAEVIPDDAAALAFMRAPDFDPAQTVILSDVSASPATRLRPQAKTGGHSSPFGSVAITSYLPERVTLEADLSAPGILVLTDADYPGWVATVDGVPTPIHRADILFRAVSLPAGHHAVVFEFKPRSFQFGVLISLATLVVAGAWWLRAGWLQFANRAKPPRI